MRILAMTLALCLAQVPSSTVEQERIFFRRDAPMERGIFLAHADGTDEQPLAASTRVDYNPAWSPKADWIVFTSERDRSADLYRIRPDGTGLERLTNDLTFDDQAAFSPNGNQLVFVTSRVDGTADLWLLELTTRRARPLTSGAGGDFRPSWSPDGRWIAFASDRGSSLPFAPGERVFVHLQIGDVYVIRPDGSGLKRVTQSGAFCGSPKWRSDSRRVVAYCVNRRGAQTRVVTIDVASGQLDDVTAGPGVKMNPHVLPSGELAYIRKDGGDPGVFYGAGRPGPAGLVRSASWSPDGTRVVYHKLLSLPGPETVWRSIPSRDPRYELFATDNGLGGVFDGRGQRMLERPQMRNSVINLIDIATGSATPIFEQGGRQASSAYWVPAQNAIIFGLGTLMPFTGNRARGSQIALIQSEGSGLRLLTSGANHNSFPSPSPDGQRFVYRTFGPEGQGLRIKRFNDDPPTTLTTEYDNFPVWSPRGDLIVFTRLIDHDFEIFTIRPDGTALTRLTRTRGNDAHAAFSPDGEWIVFSTSRWGFKDEEIYTDGPQPYGELIVMRYNGTDARQLTDNQWEDGSASWQPRVGPRPQ